MHETVLVNVSASKGKNWLRELQKEKNTIAAAAATAAAAAGYDSISLVKIVR